jgi:hypothetical protein
LSITWRPSGLACWEGRASQPKKFEAALFRAVVVEVVVHRALREVGQLLQSQSPLQRPDIIRRVEAASAATPARAQPGPPHCPWRFPCPFQRRTAEHYKGVCRP